MSDLTKDEKKKRGITEKIMLRTERNIAYYAAHRDEIDQRLSELDNEWDIERTLEANVSTITMASLLAGSFINRKWLFISALMGGLMFQNAVQGWCLPLPLFRQLGVRTQIEIERERYALKALRGDFNQLITSETETRGNVVYLSRKIIDAVTGRKDKD